MQYTIKNVAIKKEYVGQYGPMIVYHLAIVDAQGNQTEAEWSRKTTSPAPTLGQAITGTISTTNWGNKFTPDPMAQTLPGQSPPASQPSFRPEDPAKSKSIRRMHSQEMAISALTLQGKTTYTEAELLEQINWFDDDASGERPAPVVHAPESDIEINDIPF